MTRELTSPAKNAPLQESHQAEYQRLSKLSTEELRRELSHSLEMTAQNLTRLALTVRALEERGEDLSGLRLGILPFLRQIAYGQVLPSVVVRFGGSALLVRTVASLPLPDQHRLAEGQPIPMVVATGHGGHTTRMADPLKMAFSQIHQVFAPGRIRDEAEQILVMTARATADKPKQEGARPRGKIAVDKKRGGLVIGKTFVPTGLLIDALSTLKDTDPEDNGPADQVMTVKLTTREHYRLKRAALDANNISANVLVRRTLLLAGLLSGPDAE